MNAALRRFDTGKLAGAKTERGYNQSTSAGRAFWSLDPQSSEIDVLDIANHLARICRFAGAIRRDIEIYSVAQHCCLVSDHCPEGFKLEGLLHDAQEAYTADLIKPIKLQLPEWKPLENRIEAAIRAKFGLPEHISPEVKEQDWHAFPTEVRDICPPMIDVDHGPMPQPWPERIEAWGVFRAREEWLTRFRRLYSEKTA